MDHYFITFTDKTKTHPIEVRFLLMRFQMRIDLSALVF